jgi:uncharacterized membrane protein YbhN (UPF0104 family)
MMQDRLALFQSRLAKRLIAAAVLAASALFLGYNLYRNWQDLKGYHWEFHYPYLLLAVFALIVTFVSNIAGWVLIIERLGGPRSFRKNAEIYCLAAHGKRLPGLFWYVAGRGYLYEREGIPVSVTVQASLWEMVFQMLAGLTLYMVFWPLYQETNYGFLNYVLLAAIPLLLLTFSPSVFRRVLQRVGRDQSEAKVIQLEWRDKLLWFFVYLAGWLTGGSILYFLAKSVSSVSLALLPACWGFVALSGVVSVVSFFLPGGAGVREISLSLLLSSYIPLYVAIALALLFRVWILLGETILLIFVWSASKSTLWDRIGDLTQTDY